MLCIYSLSKCIGSAILTFVNGEDKTPVLRDGCVEAFRHNPLSASLRSDHWSWRLTCGVCLEYFKDPVILPCGHTFCRRCLVTLIDYERRRRQCIPIESLRVRCPECRHVFRVHSVRNRFVHNITAASILEGWLDELKSRCLVDRAVQVVPDQFSSGTQIPSTNLEHTFGTIKSSRQAKGRMTVSIESPSPTRMDDKKARPADTGVQVRGKVWLNDQQPLHALRPLSVDQWGMYSFDDTHINRPLTCRTGWVSPKSDISKYAWYLNQFVFAFFMAMCCTGQKF